MAGCTDFDPIRTTNKLTVEQVDREATWKFRPLSFGSEKRIDWMAGLYDDLEIIQAFARHRQQAEARGLALEQATRDILPYLKWTISPESPGYHPTMPSAVAAFDDALTAYRSARP